MTTRRAPKALSPTTTKRMRATLQRDTPPERALRCELHRLGLRFRTHQNIVPGVRRAVDIVFRRVRVAIFVDGCFWHGCPLHGTLPKKTNRAWWAQKIDDNKRRDLDTNARLKRAGWKVARVWEHEEPARAAKRVARIIGTRRCIE